MIVRVMQPGEAPVLRQVFIDAALAVGPTDYSSEQVAVWAAQAPNMEHWRDKFHGRVVLVAEGPEGILGFASLEQNGHIDHMYVRAAVQRKGIGSALLHEIEYRAGGLNLDGLFTEASATARPFFEHAGFRMIAAQSVCAGGLALVNYRMEKVLR